MSLDDAKNTIIEECLKPGGFASTIRENQVDEKAFVRLLDAVDEFAQAARSQDVIDRLIVACLFELPWEIENTVDHYSQQSQQLGVNVSKMADKLRAAVNDMLWGGLESHYEGSGSTGS